MTILEKKSNRKKMSILSLVKKGEYSAGYAMILVEELNDAGRLTDNDYEELATYLEDLLNEEAMTENDTEEVSSENEPTENTEEEGE